MYYIIRQFTKQGRHFFTFCYCLLVKDLFQLVQRIFGIAVQVFDILFLVFFICYFDSSLCYTCFGSAFGFAFGRHTYIGRNTFFVLLCTVVDADIDPCILAFVFSFVVDIFPRQRACSQVIFICRGVAVDNCAFQVGIIADSDVKSAFAGIDTALVGDAVVFGVGFAAAGSAADAYTCCVVDIDV